MTDIVVFGASGFSGRLVCEYLAENAGDTSWAIADMLLLSSRQR